MSRWRMLYWNGEKENHCSRYSRGMCSTCDKSNARHMKHPSDNGTKREHIAHPQQRDTPNRTKLPLAVFGALLCRYGNPRCECICTVLQPSRSPLRDSGPIVIVWARGRTFCIGGIGCGAVQGCFSVCICMESVYSVSSLGFLPL